MTNHGLAGRIKWVSGAEHCQHDSPTLGQELMLDWLCDVFKIDQTKLAHYPG